MNVDSEGEDQDMADDTFAIKPFQTPADLEPQEVRIERDPETGVILHVFDDANANPLNDPLNELGDTEMPKINSLGFVPKSRRGAKDTEVTRALEEYALSGVERLKRGQSKGEEQWIVDLVEKHGDDYKGMFWDRKLNPMQQSLGDIRKRVKKYQERQAQKETVVAV
jgi:nucleolar protein 16